MRPAVISLRKQVVPSAGQGPRIPRRYNVAWNDHLVAVIHAAAHRDRRMRPKTGAKLPTGPPGRSQSPNQAAVTRQAFLGRPKHMSNGKPEATSTLLACMLCREKGGGRFIGRLDRLLVSLSSTLPSCSLAISFQSDRSKEPQPTHGALDNGRSSRRHQESADQPHQKFSETSQLREGPRVVFKWCMGVGGFSLISLAGNPGAALRSALQDTCDGVSCAQLLE